MFNQTPTADECYNPDGIVPRSIRLLKDKYPDLIIYTDVALDPYNEDGHDGIVREDGQYRGGDTGFRVAGVQGTGSRGYLVTG